MKVRGTGARQQVVQYRRARLPDRKPGEHLWIIAGIWRTDPTRREEVHLDTENLITVDGPGCFWCERTYRKGDERTRCPTEGAR